MDSYDLITGGAGFIGSNLADALLRDGRRVVVADTLVRPGSERNAAWLRRRHGDLLSLRRVDVRDASAIGELARGARTIYHLAAQVAVTTSMVRPREDVEVNLLGTFNVLEGARAAPVPPPVLYTSTNKVYGALQHLDCECTPLGYRFRDCEGVDEDTPLDFHSPYGCSKGAADQYVRDYARVFSMPTVVFRMSCIYGERQHGTEDQGWVAHLARSVLAGKPVTIYGDGQQTRDVLWIEDLVRAMRAATARANEIAGSVFNIGGGAGNMLSVRGTLERLMKLAGARVPVASSAWRAGDQRVYVSALRRAEERLGWRPTVDANEGLVRLLAWLKSERARSRRDAPRLELAAEANGRLPSPPRAEPEAPFRGPSRLRARRAAVARRSE
jgi:CDP-paratose 2-epimerase